MVDDEAEKASGAGASASKHLRIVGWIAGVSLLVALCAWSGAPLYAIAYVFYWITGYEPGM